MHRLRSNGNVPALVDSADGSLDAKYEYGAFGEPLRVGGTSIAADNPFRFSTKYTDVDGARKRVDGDAEGVARRAEEAAALWALMRQSGLLYYGFRYYSPSLGRFLNRDPLGELGGSNLYGFVENDPVNGWDYLGLNDELICGPSESDAGLCDDGGGDYYSWIEQPWGAEGYYFDWDGWNWGWNARPKFKEGPEFYFDMELFLLEGACFEGGCPKVPVQQKPQPDGPTNEPVDPPADEGPQDIRYRLVRDFYDEIGNRKERVGAVFQVGGRNLTIDALAVYASHLAWNTFPGAREKYWELYESRNVDTGEITYYISVVNAGEKNLAQYHMDKAEAQFYDPGVSTPRLNRGLVSTKVAVGHTHPNNTGPSHRDVNTAMRAKVPHYLRTFDGNVYRIRNDVPYTKDDLWYATALGGFFRFLIDFDKYQELISGEPR